jgi:ATP-dependent DNA ligase
MTPHPALQSRPAELVQLFGSWNGKVPPEGCWVEEKLDGFRAAWINGQFVTRDGVSIEGAGHIVHALHLLERAYGEPAFFDGEWQVGGTLAATQAHFARRGRGGDAGTLHLFDAMPLSEWKADACTEILAVRKRRLVEAFTAMQADPLAWEWAPGSRGRTPKEPALAIVPDRWLATAADVWQLARETWARGGEGLVLKDAESLYQRRRASTWWKVKL